MLITLHASAQTIEAPEGVELSNSIYPDEVSAPSFAKLAKRLKKSGPKNKDGKVSISDTQADWKVGIETRTPPNLCETTNVTIKLNVVTTLPNWVEYDKAPP